MRNAPLIAVRASLRRGTNPLHARAVIRNGSLHVKVVDLDIQPLLSREKVGVVERRLQQLAHVRRHALLGEQQGIARFVHAPSLDEIQHEPRLLWRDSQVTHFRSKFHSRYLSYWRLAKSRFYAFGAVGVAPPAGAEGVIAPGPPGIPAGFAATSVAALMEWPLNWRVKLNSPSLWPTMFSVTYTGINFLPLCTAIVCPTISGTTVERRDQVRSTFFSLREFMPSTLARR